MNALLGLLLPFAFTPLVKFNCSPNILGENASKGLEKYLLYTFAMAVWAINATTISAQGGGFFGDILPGMEPSFKKVALIIIQVLLQLFYAWWNFSTLFSRDGYDNIEQQPSDSADDSGLPNESQTEIEIT